MSFQNPESPPFVTQGDIWNPRGSKGNSSYAPYADDMRYDCGCPGRRLSFMRGMGADDYVLSDGTAVNATASIAHNPEPHPLAKHGGTFAVPRSGTVLQ